MELLRRGSLTITGSCLQFYVSYVWEASKLHAVFQLRPLGFAVQFLGRDGPDLF